MTNRERVLSVLKGDIPDRIPFTIYDWKIPWGYDKRKLRERGLVIMERFPGWRAEHIDCQLKTICYTEEGERYEREMLSTPHGEVTALFLYDQTTGARRQIEFWIKGEKDYEPLMYMISHTVYYPAYDDIIAAKEDLGEDGFVWVWAGYSPLQKIMLRLTGIEQFCYELVDRPDLLWDLYDALWERDRRKYPIIAEAPVEMIQYCANPIAKVLGRDLFVSKVLPCLNECAEVIHAAGKILSTHVDGDNAIWATDLAHSSVDVVEAFTPSPDTDMSMRQARDLFKNKIIWANFPSSVHVASVEKVREITKEILRAVSPGDRFLLGITEDVPGESWRRSLNAILDVLERYGNIPMKNTLLEE